MIAAKRRRENDKIRFRKAILDTSIDIAETEGWNQFTIRKLCSRLEYSAPVIYQYFESKEQILQAVRQSVIEDIGHRFSEIDLYTSGSESRMMEYALYFWDFAIEHPSKYQILYSLQYAPDFNQNKASSSHLLIDFYKKAFLSISPTCCSDDLVLEYCDNWISLIHGFIAMNMVHKIRSGGPPKNVYINSIQRFLKSIQQ